MVLYLGRHSLSLERVLTARSGYAQAVVIELKGYRSSCTIHWLSGTTSTVSIEHHNHDESLVPVIHVDKLSLTHWQRTLFLQILACPEETPETLEGQSPTEETEEPLRTPSALSGGTLTPIPEETEPSSPQITLLLEDTGSDEWGGHQ